MSKCVEWPIACEWEGGGGFQSANQGPLFYHFLTLPLLPISILDVPWSVMETPISDDWRGRFISILLSSWISRTGIGISMLKSCERNHSETETCKGHPLTNVFRWELRDSNLFVIITTIFYSSIIYFHKIIKIFIILAEIYFFTTKHFFNDARWRACHILSIPKILP